MKNILVILILSLFSITSYAGNYTCDGELLIGSGSSVSKKLGFQMQIETGEHNCREICRGFEVEADDDDFNSGTGGHRGFPIFPLRELNSGSGAPKKKCREICDDYTKVTITQSDFDTTKYYREDVELITELKNWNGYDTARFSLSLESYMFYKDRCNNVDTRCFTGEVYLTKQESPEKPLQTWTNSNSLMYWWATWKRPSNAPDYKWASENAPMQSKFSPTVKVNCR